MSLNTLNFALNNGVHIPSIGLGTYQTADFSTLTNTLQTALSLGYRHIDTAAFYKNEKMIGQVLQDLIYLSLVNSGQQTLVMKKH